jgi:hypothetical protein
MELVVTFHFKMPGLPYMSYSFLVGSQEVFPQGIFSAGRGGGGGGSVKWTEYPQILYVINIHTGLRLCGLTNKVVAPDCSGFNHYIELFERYG